MRYSVLIIEDDVSQADLLHNAIKKSTWSDGLDIYLARNHEELVDFIKSDVYGHLDILFADMHLGDGNMTGVEIVTKYFQGNCAPQVIYTTGRIDMVSSAYTTEHIYVLGKPIRLDQLSDAMQKAILALEAADRECMAVRSGSSIIKVVFRSIVWLESLHHKVSIHMSDKTTIVVYDTLSGCASKLPSRFFRVHKSFVVNYDQVSCLDKDGFLMADGARIPVSRRNYAEVRKSYLAYVSRIL